MNTIKIQLDQEPNIGDVLTDSEYSGVSTTYVGNGLFEMQDIENQKYLTTGTILYKMGNKILEGNTSSQKYHLTQFKIQ